MKQKKIYKIIFASQEKIFEIYAKAIDQQCLFGFVAVESLLFDEFSSVVVDPGQERLKAEFQGVKRTYIPMHSILRIDEVEQKGIAKISELKTDTNISQFPKTIYTKAPQEH